MKKNKILIELVARIVFGVALLIILFLIALNGRYTTLGNNSVLDKWKRQVNYIGYSEIPIIRDGVDIFEKSNKK